MITTSKLRRYLHRAMKLLTATGLPLEVIYEGKVYQIQTRETDLKPIYHRPYPIWRRKVQLNKHMLEYGDCRECGYLTVNDNCLNVDCPTLVTDPKRLFSEDGVPLAGLRGNMGKNTRYKGAANLPE